MKKISFVLILILGVFFIPFSVLKAAPVNNDLVYFDNLNIYVNNVNYNKGWTLFEDGYYYYNISALQPLPESNVISIYSTNIKYKYIEFYSDGFNYVFDISRILGINLTFIDLQAPQIPFWGLNISSYDNKILEGTSYKLNENYKIRIRDFEFLDNANFAEGYQRGYTNAEIDLLDPYYEIGYQAAKDEFYLSRYAEGRASVESDNNALIDYIPGILGVVVAFFFQIASISFAGVSILDVLVAMFAVVVGLMIFKMFLGGK